ncbi:potassium channel subfamily K member 16-like [Lytechinus variegatus]|uniref:potassium channel subfamily K member 16-like n=1 Tax=Lytechinus variegatus TaxID=7654 RepID=UPI001BB2A4EB|nr:potassium channel subfamily K member 16-like [Lytechinus variegatus]
MNGLRLSILTFLLFVYLLLGAVVFHFLEQEHEDNVRIDLMAIRSQFLDTYPCLTEDILMNFTSILLQARNSGVTMDGNRTSPSNWDFSSAFFFSGTVVTTIGYGAIAPKTYGGQLFCMVYAALGIPYTAWILASVGSFYEKTMKSHIGKADQALKMMVKKSKIRKVFLGIVVAAVSYTIFLIIPAVIFMFLEHWSFHIAHYYTFITLTTVGFGDYIATVDGPMLEHWLYDLMVTLWNILGLAYLAILISVIRKGEMKTEGSLRKFHAKVLNRRQTWKAERKHESEAVSSIEGVKFRSLAPKITPRDEKDYDVLYTKTGPELGDVILPCFVDLESMNTVEKTDDVGGDHGKGDISKCSTEVVTIDGQIVEDRDTNDMCIILQCENVEDLDTVEKVIHAALEERVLAKMGLPHQSVSLKTHYRQPKICTQGTQTE